MSRPNKETIPPPAQPQEWKWHENGNLYTESGTYKIGEYACEVACAHNATLSAQLQKWTAFGDAVKTEDGQFIDYASTERAAKAIAAAHNAALKL